MSETVGESTLNEAGKGIIDPPRYLRLDSPPPHWSVCVLESILHVLLDVPLIVRTRVDVAVTVDGDSDRRLHAGIHNNRRRNEILHAPVFGTADADAAPATRIVICIVAI